MANKAPSGQYLLVIHRRGLGPDIIEVFSELRKARFFAKSHQDMYTGLHFLWNALDNPLDEFEFDAQIFDDQGNRVEVELE